MLPIAAALTGFIIVGALTLGMVAVAIETGLERWRRRGRLSRAWQKDKRYDKGGAND